MRIDEDRVDWILQRIIEAIKPDQGGDSIGHIFAALQGAIIFQMSLLCPDCRRRLARKLRSDIPAMLRRARELQQSAQQEHGEQHLH